MHRVTLALLAFALLPLAAEEGIDPATYSLVYQKFGPGGEACPVRPGEEAPELVKALFAAPTEGVVMVTDPAKGPDQDTPIGPMKELRPELGIVLLPKIEAASLTPDQLAKHRKRRVITLYKIKQSLWIQSLEWDPKSYWYVDSKLDLKVPE